jgi:hypothetical protein
MTDARNGHSAATTKRRARQRTILERIKQDQTTDDTEKDKTGPDKGRYWKG